MHVLMLEKLSLKIISYDFFQRVHLDWLYYCIFFFFEQYGAHTIYNLIVFGDDYIILMIETSKITIEFKALFIACIALATEQIRCVL